MAKNNFSSKIFFYLVSAVIFMFFFSFMLVPLYNVFCEVTGLNGKIYGPSSFFVKDEVEKKDSREIRIKFLSQVNESAPVNFFPSSNEVRVWTDKVSKTSYIAENTTDKQLTLTIIPSVSPGLAAENVKKIQCFCFEEQVLMPYERQEWPVRFYVSSEVGDNINDIYLSYTLFETDRVLTDNMNHGK